MQPNSADSVKNKELLWGTLQESGAFAGLTMDQFQPVQSAFDRVVQQAARSSMSLSDTNKHIIREFMQVLRSVQIQNPTQNPTQNPIQNPTPNPNNNATKKKKIEMVYRADDLKNERANEFERQLREKQAEMDSFLTLKKPTDVSFADASIDEDKPIGDEMSRLIANELAARERELVQLKPEDIKKAQQWIGATSDNSINANATITPSTTVPSKKSVSFSNINTSMRNVVEEEHEVEQFEPNEPTNFSKETDFEETGFIFSKFKRISEPLTDIGLPEPGASASVAVQQLYDRLIAIEEQMNANHAEIMAYLKGKGPTLS